MGLQKKIKGLDLFALPFRFSLGDEEKEKKTFIGGILSICVCVISLAYFVYLCYLYAGNLMQPSIAQTEQFSTETFTMDLQPDFLMVKVTLSNQQSLWEYQQQTKKVLLLTVLRYTYKDATGNQVDELAQGIPCDSPKLSNYQCFTLPSFKDKIPLHYTEQTSPIGSLLLVLTKCVSFLVLDGYTCETDDTIINKYLLNINSNIQVFFGLKQYDTSSKSFIPNQRIETYILDPKLAFYSRIDLQKSDTSISEGFLIQTSKDYTNLSGYSRTDSAMTQDFISQQLQVNAYGGIFFNLKSTNIAISIQFAQFTQLLAQFSSVFSSLMILGIFSKLLAESEIAQSMIALQLKVYYKLTAVQLISLKKKGLKDKEPITEKQDNLRLQKEIEALDFEKSLSQSLHLSLPKRIFSFLSSSKSNQKDSAEIRVYKQLLAQASKCFNIFYIQKEILQMKMMLRLILSPEQFAAALLCGSKLPIDLSNKESNQEKKSAQKTNPPIEIKNPAEQYLVDTNAHRDIEDIQIEQGVDPPIPDSPQIDDQSQNHLETVDKIESDSVVQGQYIQKFLDIRFVSEIDKRIKNCMIKPDKPEQKLILKDDIDSKNISPFLSPNLSIDKINN